MALEAAMAKITDLYGAFGDRDYVGEAITQLEHALQAAKCAVDAGCSDAVVVASLLHDTGHLVGLRDTSLPRMGEFGIVKHETIGQAFCDELGLPPVVGQLVAGHVDAKRYLCWKNREDGGGSVGGDGVFAEVDFTAHDRLPAAAGYLRRLSPASTATLGFQGGPMGDEEGLRFESNPLCKAILKMRTFDEAAKGACADLVHHPPATLYPGRHPVYAVVGMSVPGLDSYAQRIQALLDAASAGTEVVVRA